MYVTFWTQLWDYYDTEEMKVCKAINTFFPESEQRDFMLELSYQIEKVLDQSQAELIIKDLQKLAYMNDWKKRVCDELKVMNCTSLNASQCVSITHEYATFNYFISILFKWTYDRYYNAKTLLHTLLHYAIFSTYHHG